MSISTNMQNSRPALVGQADIYIPRLNRDKATHQFVMSVFTENRIGYVENIDFVEINANHNATDANGEPLPFAKHPTLVSAFVRVFFWDKDMLNAIRNPPNVHKLYLFSYSDEHWLLLPNKTPVDRTILNIHQVAHYTSEVQSKIADLTKIMDGIILQNKELVQSVELLMRMNANMQSDIEDLKKSKTIVHIVHADADRKLTSHALCGNS